MGHGIPRREMSDGGGDSMTYKFECKHCGSTDLEFKMWVNQDMEITDDCEEHPYCNVCEEETRVTA